MMRKGIIPYGRQDITSEDVKAVSEVLLSDFLTQGPAVQDFEEAFSKYVGSSYSIAVSNGTAALHLSALALGVNSNTRVITTPITFAASANCILYCGGKIEFADIDPSTGTIDVYAVEEMLRSKPKGYYHGIIPVDLAGFPVNMELLRQLANEHNLWIIEDACHAPGAYFTDSQGVKQRCGANTYADLTVFSFHPVKHLATGEGGMITTNNPDLYKSLLKLRTHGITKDPALLQRNDGGWYYEMQELGFNYRIPDILCALGLSQLKKAKERLSKRIEIAKRYDAAFGESSIVKPLVTTKFCAEKGVQHAYHLYIIRTRERLRLYDFLRENQIMTQVHYIPIYKMPYYVKNGYGDVQCPHAEAYYNECLSLPMYPSLSEDDQQYVIETIQRFTN